MIPIYTRAPQARSFARLGWADVFVPIQPQPKPQGSYVSRENTELNAIEWVWCAVEDMDRLVGPPPQWHIELCPVPLHSAGFLCEPILLRRVEGPGFLYEIYYQSTQEKRLMTFTDEQHKIVEFLVNKTLVARRMPEWVSRGSYILESAEPTCQRGVWGWLLHWVKK